MRIAVPTWALGLAAVVITTEGLVMPASAQNPFQALPGPPLLRRQTVAPLPGALDGTLMLNDNNPELIRAAGILLSGFRASRGFDGNALGSPAAHLDVPLRGRFELFSHHVFAGRADSLDSTLWLAVVAAPRGTAPVSLRLASGATALSQSPDGRDPAAPFLPLPTLLEQGSTAVWSGPGSRVATELLERGPNPSLPALWNLKAGRLSTLLVLPIPVRGLDPLLNGRNLQLRFEADGEVDVAVLAAFGAGEGAPPEATWGRLLAGDLSPKEHAPTPRGAGGAIVYSRVSGVQVGAIWRGRITDPGSGTLAASRAPISWPISSLERGTLGTGQVQSAELKAFYPGTAWAAHGNYGVLYDLTIPLRNDTATPQRLALALESPLKHHLNQGGLRFHATPSRQVMFRGTVEVSGLDGGGRRRFHLVLRGGEKGPALGVVNLAPAQERLLRVRLIYPADATPPQVLSLLPVRTQTESGEPVKQSGASPVAIP